MRSWIGAAVDRDGHRFNKTVRDRLAAMGLNTQLEVKMTALGGSHELGDIDVLAWRPATGIVYAIECKRLSFARSVGEVGERLQEYARIAPTGEKRTPVQKHLDRMAHLNQNTNGLSMLTGIAEKNIVIKSCLVTDYLVPMQFSQRALSMLDVVSDLALIGNAFAAKR
jgi:hypothetical protein